MKKNIIFINIDGGRIDRATKSHSFNKLKSKSIFFSQTITYAPYTTAAIHALGSGCYGNRTGTNSYWHSLRFNRNKFKSLVDYLKENGYFTYADAQSDLIWANHGFDEFHVHDEQQDDLISLHTDILEKINIKNNNRKNFFLFLSYSKIHTGYMNEVMKVYDNYSKEYFENRELNEKRYDTLFHYAEQYLEKLMEKIENLGLDKNSLIFIFSDHGTSVGEKLGECAYGAFCYDYTLKTLAYLWSNDFEPKEITNQVRHIDFMPTILDYLGIEIDKNFEKIDGESLLPLINGEKLSEKFAFSETANPLKEKSPPDIPNTKSIRTSNWKLIFNEYNNTRELYDLKNDPHEKNNLAGQDLPMENVLWKELLKIDLSS